MINMEENINPLLVKSLEGIEEAYKRILEEEKSIDERLEWSIGNRHHLEAKLSQLAHLAPTLKIVEEDAKKLENTIKFTSELANNVSSKVRELDLAKGRVSDVQQRVGDLLDLEACADGVTTALHQDDFEKAAGHIYRFLSMDECVLRHSGDALDKGASIETWFDRLRKAHVQLSEIINENFDVAVKDKDDANIDRYFKLFPLVDRHEQGLRKFTQYLCTQIRVKTEANILKAKNTSRNDKRAPVIWADTLILLFEEIARMLEVRQPIIETYYRPGELHIVMEVIQEECDALAKIIVYEMQNQRRLNKVVSDAKEILGFGSSTQSASGDGREKMNNPLDPRELDALLNELTSMNAQAELYFRFVKRRITSDYEAGITDTNVRSKKMELFEMKLRHSQVACDMAMAIGSYTILEQCYLNESFKKAISLDSSDTNTQTSSLVDDVFYIIKKCVRRAISSCSVDGVCAMLNHSSDLLERQLLPRFHKTLRKGFPAQGYLDLTQAYSTFQSFQNVKSSSTADLDSSRQVFLTALNNAETSCRYIKNLKDGFRDTISSSMIDSSRATSRDKLDSCLSDLGATTERFRSVVDFGFSQLRSTAIKPKVKTWIDLFNGIPHDMTEVEFNSYEANNPFSQQLMLEIDSFLSGFLSQLTTENHKFLVEILVKEVAAQLEKSVFKTTFNRFGGLLFDREVRTIAGYLSQVSEFSVREHLARLTQIAILLNMEDLKEVSEYSSDVTWRLTPAEIKKVLALRVDFKFEDIQRLKF